MAIKCQIREWILTKHGTNACHTFSILLYEYIIMPDYVRCKRVKANEIDVILIRLDQSLQLTVCQYWIMVI